VSHNPVSIPDQPRCKHCGDPIPAGDRRPREFCSSRCRQAAYRKATARTNFRTDPVLPQRPEDLDAPTVESAKNGAENPNKINGRNFVTDGPSVPLNVFGRGYHWPGAKANGNAVRIAAAVDAELGVGGQVIVSPDGVAVTVAPSRNRSRVVRA
jgi:hypothetical protein